MTDKQKRTAITIGMLLMLAVFLIFGMRACGYRLNPIDAATAAEFMQQGARQVGAYPYEKIHFFLYETPENYILAQSVKNGLFWKNGGGGAIPKGNAKVNLLFCYPFSADTGAENRNGITLILTACNDPAVSYFEFGPPENRQKISCSLGHVIAYQDTQRSLDWSEYKGTAYSEDGTPLYLLGYRKYGDENLELKNYGWHALAEVAETSIVR